MYKITQRILIAVITLSSISSSYANDIGCSGHFVNPISDVSWGSMFPLTIGAMPIIPNSTGLPDTPNPSMPICLCDAPPPLFIRIGLSVGYWEPSSMADITQAPFCMVNMGFQLPMGFKMQEMGATTTKTVLDSSQGDSAFYWVHWYKYPLISWLELLMDGACMDVGGFDLAYFSEVDPMWDDDTLAFIMNPEAILFGNPIAQLSCATDAITSMIGLPLDPLFWCAGAQGSIYPFTGWSQTNVSQPSNAVLMDERTNAKLHRVGVVLDSFSGNLCHSIPTEIMPKSHYRYQFVNPVPEAMSAFQYGRSTTVVSDPLEGTLSSQNNFGILNFKKRSCCFL